MKTQPVVSAVISALSASQSSQARKAGELFARSELEADEAFEVFARALGEKPVYALYEGMRVEWIVSYTDTKPNAKGNSADKAFGRFMGRLQDKYAIEVQKPKADNPAAAKKRAEREAKREALLKAHEAIDTSVLRDRLTRAFTTLASQPDSKVAEAAVKNLKAVLRERTRGESEALKAELTAKRAEIRGLLSGCDDIERLDAVIDILSPANDVVVQ